jgi:sugar (pentulose or hexulose) kinase
MTEVVLGIDFGTSGVRIAARGRDGAELAFAAAPINTPITEMRALQDPALWWEAIGQAFAKLNLKGLNVLALAIDGTSGSIVAVDGAGVPLGLASMYNDVAEANAIVAVKAVASRDTAALGSTSPLARAISMQKGATRILHQADWLLGKFCGRFDVSDENNALKTGYDPVTRVWPHWIEKAGLPLSLLPEVVSVGTKVGMTLSDVTQAFGLPKDVAVVTGTTDGCAAFLASGASKPGDGVTSLGTTLTLKLLSSKPVFAPEYGIYSHRIGDQWLAGGASNSGGAVLGQYFSKDEIERLSALIDPAVASGFDYYPLPKVGERFPINDPAYVPRIEPRPSDDAKFLQGLFEGIAGIEALGYQRLADLGASPLVSMRSVGGGASNSAWTSIRMKKLGVPQLSSASEHAAMGTARLAWRGIGHED